MNVSISVKADFLAVGVYINIDLTIPMKIGIQCYKLTL
jgi:hypothetical protein